MQPSPLPQSLAATTTRAVSRPEALPPATAVSLFELVVLSLAGTAAALAMAFLPLRLGIPGHKIVLAALPLLVGFRLSPRAWSGTAMGLAAAATAGVCLTLGAGRLQPSALVSLLAFGPLLDVMRAGAPRQGWQLFARCAAAGLTANLGAFVVRWGMAVASWESLGFHSLQDFGSSVCASFALCGLAAGAIVGLAFLRWTSAEER